MVDLKRWIPVLLGLQVLATAQGPDPYKVRFSRVAVDRASIRLDSTASGLSHYSGILRYDLASEYDSVPVHVYLEEVPFKRAFLIYHDLGGASRFRPIDSLCRGDVGWVKPKKGCLVRWKYATAKGENHCRLKVGLGNLAYLVQTDSMEIGQGGSRATFTYNNLGLPVRRSVRSGAGEFAADYRYNRFGQALFEPPNVWNRYDEKFRLAFSQKGEGPTLQFIYGYVYDSLSRLAEKQHLRPGPTRDQPGPPFNRELFRLDRSNRVVYQEKRVASHSHACNPEFRFEGTERTTVHYYGNSADGKVDSSINENLDSTRAQPLLLRITRVNRRNADSVLLETWDRTEGFDTAKGSCFAPALGGMSLVEYRYDAFGHNDTTVIHRKSAGDSVYLPVATLCAKWEYDFKGRPIRKSQDCSGSIGAEIVYDDYGHIQARKYPGSTQYFGRMIFDLDQLEDLVHE